MSYKTMLIAGMVVFVGPAIAQTSVPAQPAAPPVPPVQPAPVAPARMPVATSAPVTGGPVAPTVIPTAARMGGSATSATQ